MTVNMWLHLFLVLITLQISNSDSFLNEAHSSGDNFNGTHRIIKRYTQRFPFPRPRLPTLSRPAFPLFPVFGPPPGHHHVSGDSAFPKIRLRPPSDDNLFTEEEDDEEEAPKKKKKKKRKKSKGNTRPQPSPEPQAESGQSESESLEEKDEHAKGESGELTNSKTKKKKATTTTAPPKNHEDRTLLTAKKALLIKKAIIAKGTILAALKTKKILAKAAKVKGVSVKGPGVVFTIGPATNPAVTAAKVAEEEEEAALLYSGDALEEEDPDEDGDGDGNTDGDDDDDDASSTDTDSVEVRPSPVVNSIDSDSSNETLSATIQPQQQQQQQQYANSMMQQLQEQLQQKQQQQLTPTQVQAQQQQYNQNQGPITQVQPQTSAEQYQQQAVQLNSAQVEQYQQQGQPIPQQYQQPLVQATVVLPPPSPAEIEYYKGSKASKKAKKKAKKKKAKPRPVNLGVKANLYKKFDQLAKKAQKKVSTFIQIDVDFLSRRSAAENAPNRFASRTLEVSAEAGSGEEPIGNGTPSRIQKPGSVPPPWIKPMWNREYPERKENGRRECGEGMHCVLKPVWILYRKNPPSHVL